MDNKKELYSISVGDDFSLFTGRNMKGQSGCIFEANDTGDFTFVIYMDDMSEEEKFLLQKAKISVGQIRENDFVVSVIRFGNSELIFEICFNPFLYTDERKANLMKSNMILMVSVESNTNKIQTLRQFNMPLKMFMSLITQLKNGIEQEDYNDRYTRWMNDLDNRYSLVQLWNVATYIGKMGEEYVNKEDNER
jgi:hypothetical protein